MAGYEDPQKPNQVGYQGDVVGGYQQQPVGGYQQQPVGGYQQQPGAYQQQAHPQLGYDQGQGYQQQGGYQQGGYQQVAQNSPGGGYGSAQGEYQQYTNQQAPILVGVPMYPDCPNDALKTKFIYQGYKDIWAAVIFIAMVLVTIVWGFVNVGKFHDDFQSNEYSISGNLTYKLGKYLPGAAFTSLALVSVMLALMRLFPRVFIVLANLIVVIVNVAAAIYGFAKVDAGVGIMFVILSLLHGLWLFLVRRRIPLAGALLANSVGVVTKHYGTIITSFLSLVVLTVYGCFFCMMVIPTFQDIDNKNAGNNSQGTSITFGQFLLLCTFLLMFFWSTQVIMNVVHVTTSGTVATWYFAGPNATPPNPSVASLKRALTTSFGSICFGSLLVAILKLLHALAHSAARHRRSFLSCIALCFVSCLERLMEYFNVYAFTHVAIYGSSFIEAAKQTWEMIKNCGITAIINDNLVFPVLNLVMFIDSLAIGVGFGYAADSWMIGVISFCISAVIHLLVLRTVFSGVVTLFVCYAENPQIIALSNPQFNQEMLEGVEALKQSAC
jgi:hypothetical protein